MKSNVCKIDKGNKDLELILKESEKVAVYNELNHKQTLQLRLLCEEIDGMLVSAEGGFFYTGEAVGEGQMVIDKDFSDFEHTLFTYANIEDEYGSFVASISLTEWGYEWDEEFNDYPTYYDSYFLPLMEEGKALPANISDIG